MQKNISLKRSVLKNTLTKFTPKNVCLVPFYGCYSQDVLQTSYDHFLGHGILIANAVRTFKFAAVGS
jgi:hypothetical protein